MIDGLKMEMQVLEEIQVMSGNGENSTFGITRTV